MPHRRRQSLFPVIVFVWNNVGWTAEYVGLAEMAAIMRWQEAVAETHPGYANWHQAANRHLVCREINGSKHAQCETSALPCRCGDG